MVEQGGGIKPKGLLKCVSDKVIGFINPKSPGLSGRPTLEATLKNRGMRTAEQKPLTETQVIGKRTRDALQGVQALRRDMDKTRANMRTAVVQQIEEIRKTDPERAARLEAKVKRVQQKF